MRMGGAVLLAAAVLLSACSGDTDEPPATEVETSAATWTPEPTTTASIAETADRPLDSRKRPIVPAVTRTLRGDTATLDLVAVYRIAPDVVAVTGVLTRERRGIRAASPRPAGVIPRHRTSPL